MYCSPTKNSFPLGAVSWRRRIALRFSPPMIDFDYDNDTDRVAASSGSCSRVNARLSEPNAGVA
jgi:hypothetical protein